MEPEEKDVGRQRLGNEYTRSNIRTVGRGVFYAVRARRYSDCIKASEAAKRCLELSVDV
jgi:hypothetical protein